MEEIRLLKLFKNDLEKITLVNVMIEKIKERYVNVKIIVEEQQIVMKNREFLTFCKIRPRFGKQSLVCVMFPLQYFYMGKTTLDAGTYDNRVWWISEKINSKEEMEQLLPLMDESYRMKGKR